LVPLGTIRALDEGLHVFADRPTTTL